MGGEIQVVSTPGAGSVFTFSIRLQQADVASVRTVLTPQSGVAAEYALRAEFPGCRILVAEDDWVNQEVALELLRETLGFAVDIAPDGLSALDMAQLKRYDLILMDVQMPELDGIGATQAIREIPGYEEIPIIAMTANAFAEDRARCMDAGMHDFVAKPVDPDHLFALMLKWLRARESAAISLSS
jgi:CheY-like chemotaxis protein